MNNYLTVMKNEPWKLSKIRIKYHNQDYDRYKVFNVKVFGGSSNSSFDIIYQTNFNRGDNLIENYIVNGYLELNILNNSSLEIYEMYRILFEGADTYYDNNVLSYIQFISCYNQNSNLNEELYINSNGTYYPSNSSSRISKVSVNVPSSNNADVDENNNNVITSNGNYTIPNGYTGWNSFTVSVSSVIEIPMSGVVFKYNNNTITKTKKTSSDGNIQWGSYSSQGMCLYNDSNGKLRMRTVVTMNVNGVNESINDLVLGWYYYVNYTAEGLYEFYWDSILLGQYYVDADNATARYGKMDVILHGYILIDN
eukprot:jgi/Orpsp1_1/1177635/evm.model.c7180000062241.1